MESREFVVDCIKFGCARFGFVRLGDGRMLALGRGLTGVISADGGRSWGEPYPLVTKDGRQLLGGGNSSIIRLASGRIAVQYCRAGDSGRSGDVQLFCATSDDEGQTWLPERGINPPGANGHPYHDAMLQTRSGRLVLPVRATYSGRRSEMVAGGAYGTVGGQKIRVAGHAHYPEMDIAFAHYSDDDGETWERSGNEVLGWPDEGLRGAYATDEPTVAQTAGGRLLMFARSTLGRIVEAWSDDEGASWSRGLPNELCNSYSPARLRAIPTTGDLLCVWNQVTPEEIRRGFRRSRLTCALSKDGGGTWEGFKTLDCADPLDHSPRQEPGPVEFVVAAQECGEMPANYCIYRYSNVRFVDDMAYVMYDRETFKYPGAPQRQYVLRAMAIEKLYDTAEDDLGLPNDLAEAASAAEGESVED